MAKSTRRASIEYVDRYENLTSKTETLSLQFESKCNNVEQTWYIFSEVIFIQYSA